MKRIIGILLLSFLVTSPLSPASAALQRDHVNPGKYQDDYNVTRNADGSYLVTGEPGFRRIYVKLNGKLMSLYLTRDGTFRVSETTTPDSYLRGLERALGDDLIVTDNLANLRITFQTVDGERYNLSNFNGTRFQTGPQSSSGGGSSSSGGDDDDCDDEGVDCDDQDTDPIDDGGHDGSDPLCRLTGTCGGSSSGGTSSTSSSSTSSSGSTSSSSSGSSSSTSSSSTSSGGNTSSGAGGQWWKATWENGKSPYTHQNFNIGYAFYNYASSSDQPQKYIDYMGGLDYIGGGVVQGWAATKSWEGIIGGPLSAGPNKISKTTQLDFANSAQTRFWWKVGNTLPKTWLGIYLVTAPSTKDNPGLSDEDFYNTWKAIVEGRHDADYVMMGRRLRWFIETQSLYGNRRAQPDQIILRPNWEFTQDTSLGVDFIEYLIKKKDMSFPQAAKFYADGMWHFAQNIRVGYNQDFSRKVRLRIAFAPAQREKYGAMDEYLKHHPDTYDMIDLMNHPAKDTTVTKQVIHDNLNTVIASRHTFAEAIPLARRYGLAIGSLEWSPRHEDRYYTAPNQGNYEYAIKEFHDLLEANKDIVAFTGSHHVSLVTEGFKSGTPYQADWQSTVRAHRQYFGKK